MLLASVPVTHRRAEDAAGEGEAGGGAILEAALDCIVVADHGGRVTELNPAAERTFGLRRDQALGRELVDLIFPPIVREAHRRSLATYLKTGRGLFDRRVETRAMRADGTEFPAEIAILPLRLRGALVFTVYLRDITERKQTEGQLRATLSELDEELRQLEAELARAAQIQAELLPQAPPPLEGFELAARCLPAREVGGDFYDWQRTGRGRVTLTVGDVMGKGMPAALLMATARATLRSVAAQNRPAASLALTNRALEVDLERSGAYLSVFHAELDTATQRLTYVDAGHGHAVVRRADGSIETLEPGGLPVGVSPEAGYREGTLDLDRGDALLVYSDGLLDARADRPLDRLAVAAGVGAVDSADEAVERLLEMAEPGGPRPDDLTLMVLRCTRDRRPQEERCS